jgi:hypothetical protein
VRTRFRPGFTVLAAVMISACASASPTPPPLTLDGLKNAEYASEFSKSGKAKLANGVYQEEIAVGAASKLTIRLLEPYAVGDLNGDGAADAAVVLVADGGGSGTFFYLAAVLNKDGQPAFASSTLLGDRVKYKSVSIQASIISVEMTKPGPSDPLCCPTLAVTMKFRLQNGQLLPID